MKDKPPFPGPFLTLSLAILINVFFFLAYSVMKALQSLNNHSFEEFKVWFPNYNDLLFMVSDNYIWFLIGLLISGTIANIALFRCLWPFLSGKHTIFQHEYRISLFTIIFSLILLEVVLIIAGYTPEKVSQNLWFKPVRELILLEGFDADSSGLFKATPKAISHVRNEITFHITNNSSEDYGAIEKHQYAEPYDLIKDFLDLHFRKTDNGLSKKLAEIKKSAPEQFTPYEKAVWTYLHQPLNEEGYRSVPFTATDSSVRKILLLGDSFTWGHSAKPITESFADIILCEGLLVYNTGVSGTDPSHYLAAAEQYIPLLKPDVVIVNIYLGNDVQYYKKEVKPGLPAFYATNAGNLTTFNAGIYFHDPYEIYDLNLIRTGDTYHRNILNRLLKRTVIGTLFDNLFRWPRKISLLGSPANLEFLESSKNVKTEIPNANEKCAKIKELAKLHNSRFILSVIPDLKNNGLTKVEDYKNLFLDIEYTEHPGLRPEHYNPKDKHFNNAGHKKYAEFLLRLINKQ